MRELCYRTHRRRSREWQFISLMPYHCPTHYWMCQCRLNYHMNSLYATIHLAVIILNKWYQTPVMPQDRLGLYLSKHCIWLQQVSEKEDEGKGKKSSHNWEGFCLTSYLHRSENAFPIPLKTPLPRSVQLGALLDDWLLVLFTLLQSLSIRSICNSEKCPRYRDECHVEACACAHVPSNLRSPQCLLMSTDSYLHGLSPEVSRKTGWVSTSV